MNTKTWGITTIFSLFLNGAYALANTAVGFATHSWWFITLGTYYTVLSITRFSVLQVQHRAKGDIATERFSERITGILFLFLSVSLIGVVILSLTDERGKKLHEILMITMALYAFTKVTFAIIGLAKARRSHSPIVKTLRNIALADALVSIFSLQRSMLVSFPGLTGQEIWLFNLLTGSAVCLLVCLLGVNLIGGRYVDMAKSKIVKANEKIAETVVGGYKKVESAVVSGYTKVEDAFVDAYLTKDGETVEEAKARLKKGK